MLKISTALLLCFLAFALFLAAQQPAAGPPDTSCPVCELPITGDLATLKAGNLRYAGNKRDPPDPKHLHQSVSCGVMLARCQKPFAVILSCSDSRVPPEVIFDLGMGDLFVVREAGNVATRGVLGSIEYAVDPGHFGAKLVVVIGHKRCGAVEAAFCPKPPPHIDTLWTLIRPAVPSYYRPKCKPHPEVDPDKWDEAVRKNVKNMAEIVARDLARESRWHGAKVVQAYYDLDNGTVAFKEN